MHTHGHTYGLVQVNHSLASCAHRWSSEMLNVSKSYRAGDPTRLRRDIYTATAAVVFVIVVFVVLLLWLTLILASGRALIRRNMLL